MIAAADPSGRRRILILGAGQFQVPLIQHARAMGLETIVCSIPGPYPGLDLADHAYPVDVRDYHALLEIARKHDISAVVTDQTDIPVPIVARVAATLNLPGIGYQCATRFTNKLKMRQTCSALGIPVPEYWECIDVRDIYKFADAVGYPIIVKPLDSQGSRGVTSVTGPEGAQTAFAEAVRVSSSATVLAEAFADGQEVSVEGMASPSGFVNLAVGDIKHFAMDNRFIPHRTFYPTALPVEVVCRLCDINTVLVQGFGLPFGITHTEMKVNLGTGQITVVEAAARGGGAFISSDLVPIVSGVNVTDLLLHCCLGEITRAPEVAVLREACGYVFFWPPVRAAEASDLAAIASIPGVYRVCGHSIVPNQVPPTICDKTCRWGPILLRAENRTALESTYAKVREAVGAPQYV
jgi:biotin carboxylase